MTKRGLAVSNCNAFMLYGIEGCHRPSWCEIDPKRRALRVEHTRQSLHLAAKLGAPTISTEPGGPIDPGVTRNCHEIEVVADCARFRMSIENVPSENPKTGRIVALSVLAALRKLGAPLAVGT